MFEVRLLGSIDRGLIWTGQYFIVTAAADWYRQMLPITFILSTILNCICYQCAAAGRALVLVINSYDSVGLPLDYCNLPSHWPVI